MESILFIIFKSLYAICILKNKDNRSLNSNKLNVNEIVNSRNILNKIIYNYNKYEK